jgi:hypothetical protein
MSAAIHLSKENKAHKLRPVLERPPIPHEHGAWVMLYAPMVVGFGAAGGTDVRMWLLLTLLVTSVFLGREAAGLLLRRRAKPGTAVWLGIYALTGAAAAAGLFASYSVAGLLAVGFVAAALFAIHSVLLLRPSRKRLDRTITGELIGTAALTLTGAAAYSVAAGPLGLTALAIWGACTGYFGGGILYVKMWLEAVKQRQKWNRAVRMEVGRPTVCYYALLTVVFGTFAVQLGGTAGILLLTAFLPSLVRAAVGYSRLSNRLPNLTRVGLLEAALAIWFTIFSTAAFRLLV